MAKVHKPGGATGGDVQKVESGGEIHIVSGGKITDDGTQASAIVDITNPATSGGYGWLTAELAATDIAKLNAALAALKGVGIIA